MDKSFCGSLETSKGKRSFKLKININAIKVVVSGRANHSQNLLIKRLSRFKISIFKFHSGCFLRYVRLLLSQFSCAPQSGAMCSEQWGTHIGRQPSSAAAIFYCVMQATIASLIGYVKFYSANCFTNIGYFSGDALYGLSIRGAEFQ